MVRGTGGEKKHSCQKRFIEFRKSKPASLVKKLACWLGYFPLKQGQKVWQAKTLRTG
jgi:hypothetical protein